MKKELLTESAMQDILAANLRFLRNARPLPLSQKTLARLLHIPRKTIINYESGRSSPSAYTIYRLANYFGCTMEELLSKKLYKERTNEF